MQGVEESPKGSGRKTLLAHLIQTSIEGQRKDPDEGNMMETARNVNFGGIS